MRGEDELADIKATVEAGSLPHARGRRFFHFGLVLNAGITPACAGKTLR